MHKYVKLLPLVLIFQACNANNTKFIEPDLYTKEKYCIVNSTNQKAIGLTRFNTQDEFIKKCNGKMIFNFDDNKCRLFTMKEMLFDIYITDIKGKYKFKVGEERLMCGKTIIESAD